MVDVSSRACLAWANKGLEAAAPIIVADYLREIVAAADKDGYEDVPVSWLHVAAMRMDPQ